MWNMLKPASRRGMYGLQSIVTLVLFFGVGILATALVAEVIGRINQSQTVGTKAANISGSGLEGLKQLGLQYPTLGVVIGAALIIGVVIAAFSFGMGKK